MRRLLAVCVLLAIAVPQACHRDEVTAPRMSAAAGGADPSTARIAFVSTRDGNREIYVMASDGSAQTRLTNVPEWDYEPSWSPDGNRIAFVSQRGRCDCLYVMAPDGSTVTALTSHDSWWGDRRPTWSPDGQAIAFTRFLADNVDVYRIAADGSAETALTHTPFHRTARDPQWSPDGSRIVFSTSQDDDTEIYLMHADGSAQARLTNTPGADEEPRWSPDGSRIAFTSHRDGTAQIYVMNADGSAQTRLTNNAAEDGSPRWSPDGSRIAFTSTRDGNVEIYVMNADGSAQTRLTNAAGADEGPSWSPDGRQIAFTSHRDGGAQIYVMNADGSGPTRLTNTPGDNTDPSWSPAYRPSSAPAHVDFTAPPPATVNANAVISPAIQVTVTDASWSRIPGGVVRLEIGTSPAPGATLSGTTQAKLVDGVATFADLRIDQPGRGYTLVATAGPASGASGAFAVAGPPAQLAFATQPPQTLEGAVAIAPAVRVALQDAFGTTVPGATQAVSLALGANPSGGTLAGTTTVQAVDGIATFDNVSVDRPGSGYTLSATSAALTGAASTPFAIRLTFRTVTVGFGHSCALTVSSAAYCWGIGGRVGDGTQVNRPSPVLVAGGLRFAALSAGNTKTCGVTTSGAAYCWGLSPEAVPGGVLFTTVSVGGRHTCGRSTSGAWYCWGDYGGEGPTPTPMNTGGLAFAVVSAGEDHTCGVTSSHQAYCAGINDVGQLGDGTTTTTGPFTFVPVAGGLTFTTVSAGLYKSTCGVTTDAAVYCWGFDAGYTPERQPAAPDVHFTAVSTGSVHACGAGTAGAAYCWGEDTYTQRGTGYPSGDTAPQGLPVTGGLSFVAISAGGAHTCGVTSDGKAYCWGLNDQGQLGNGTIGSHAIAPVQVVQ
ncbi:MAG: hypothetical protein DMD45_04205 [Gemmatimonadetes bacterium]|nr:MAG: hypothetical protein DMD45_04205 [Gemmatimonadota bacterium]